MNYSIREVSKLVNLSEHTLRYYEKLNLIGIKRDSSKKRVYDDKNIEEILYIKSLKSIGFKLDEIKKYSTLKSKDRETLVKRRDLLKEQQIKLDSLIEELLKTKRIIDEKLSCIEGRIEKEV